MPSCSKHLRQAKHNEDFAFTLVQSSPILYKDWAVIVAFYSAVHYIEAYLDNVMGKHSAIEAAKKQVSPHVYRVQVARRKLASIAWEYNDLYEQSLFARYLEANGSEDEPCGGNYTEKSVKIRVDYLDKIRNEINSLIKSA